MDIPTRAHLESLLAAELVYDTSTGADRMGMPPKQYAELCEKVWFLYRVADAASYVARSLQDQFGDYRVDRDSVLMTNLEDLQHALAGRT